MKESNFTPPPYPLNIHIKQIRYRHQHRNNRPQNSQRPMHAHIPVKRHPHNRHPARRRIPHERNARQRRRRIHLVAINDILITRDEHAQHAVAEQHPREEGGGQILMCGYAVQPIQNREMGIAGAPNMAYQRRNSGGRRVPPGLGWRPCRARSICR